MNHFCKFSKNLIFNCCYDFSLFGFCVQRKKEITNTLSSVCIPSLGNFDTDFWTYPTISMQQSYKALADFAIFTLMDTCYNKIFLWVLKYILR